MKNKLTLAGSAIAFLAASLGFQSKSIAQATATAAIPTTPPITVYQFRKVAPDKAEEFVKRETTYASEVARKAMAKNNLTFWCLLEKVGGEDMENSPNYMFINTYKDIDAAGDTWNFTAAFPGVAMDKMETNSISKTTSAYFLRDFHFEQAAGAVPEKDFKYVALMFHKVSDASAFVASEKKHFGPFIKSAMDKKQTSQVGWGNAIVLSPVGMGVPFNTVSYDLFRDLKNAISPWFDEKLVLPTDGMNEIMKLETGGRQSSVWRIVKVVEPPR